MKKFLLVNLGLYFSVAAGKKKKVKTTEKEKTSQKIIIQLMNVNPVQHIDSHFS